MTAPLRELRRLMKKRLVDKRDIIGVNIAAMKAVGRITNERKSAFSIIENESVPGVDIWAGLGLGSDVAAALQNNKRRKH